MPWTQQRPSPEAGWDDARSWVIQAGKLRSGRTRAEVQPASRRSRSGSRRRSSRYTDGGIVQPRRRSRSAAATGCARLSSKILSRRNVSNHEPAAQRADEPRRGYQPSSFFIAAIASRPAPALFPLPFARRASGGCGGRSPATSRSCSTIQPATQAGLVFATWMMVAATAAATAAAAAVAAAVAAAKALAADVRATLAVLVRAAAVAAAAAALAPVLALAAWVAPPEAAASVQLAAAAAAASVMLLLAWLAPQLQVLSVQAPSVASRVPPKRLASRVLPKRKVVARAARWASASAAPLVDGVVPRAVPLA